MRLWKTIFKNEILLKTSSFRRHRKSFFLILYSIGLFWGLYLGPNFFDIILPNLFKTYSGLYKPLVILIIEQIFAIIFLSYMIYPLYNLYRKKEIGYKDILLSSPAKPGDIFLGEFLAMLPFYSLGILFIGPIITSMIMQITVISIFHILIIYLSILGLSFLGLLIGTMLANWLEYLMLKNEKLRELDKFLLLIISLIVILVFYFFQFTLENISRYSELRVWFQIYPSFWYSNIVIFIIDPSLQDTFILNLWISSLLAVLIPVLFLILAYKMANKHYVVDYKYTKASYQIEEKRYYNFIRKLTLSKWEILVITQFKEFFRKKENVVKIFYVIGLTCVIGLILLISSKDLSMEFGTEFFYKRQMNILLLSWIGSIIFGILMGMNIFMSSKEILFLYKRTPRGVKSLIISYLYQMFILILFLDIILTIIFTFIFILEISTIILFFTMFLMNCLIFLLQAAGIQCCNPLFEERGKDIFFNIYLLILLQIISLIITLFIIIPNLPYTIDKSLGLIYILLINSAISFGIGFVVFFIGIIRLEKIEV